MSSIQDNLYSGQFFDMFGYIGDSYPMLDVPAVLTRMLVDLKSCPAVTAIGFKKWAHAYVKTYADDIRERQVSSLEDVVALARHLDTEEKPPFVYQQHPTRPEVTFVSIERGRAQHAVWILPTDKLGLAQVLHSTIEVRFTRIGNRRYAYLVKRCQQQLYSGAWHTVERDLLSIWLGTDWPICAIDTNYLNYLPENLRVDRPTNQDALNRAAHELRPDKDTLDWKPDRATAVPFNEDNRELSHSLTRTPPNAHEVEVSRWLYGNAKLSEKSIAIEVKDAEHAFDDAPKVLSVDEAVKSLRKQWGAQEQI
jgi:hypothetical protein